MMLEPDFVVLVRRTTGVALIIIGMVIQHKTDKKNIYDYTYGLYITLFGAVFLWS